MQKIKPHFLQGLLFALILALATGIFFLSISTDAARASTEVITNENLSAVPISDTGDSDDPEEVINLTPMPEIIDDSDNSASGIVEIPIVQHNNIRAGEDVASPFINLQYTLLFWDGTWIVTLRGVIDPELILPATVEVAVPAGTMVNWIGEVDPGLEEEHIPPREILPPWNIYNEGDIDIYTAVLEHSHAIQLEFPYNGNPIVPSSEDGAVEFSYTPLTDVDELWLATAIPANSAVTDKHLQELDGVGPNGELTFARVFLNAEGGTEYTALIEYRTGVTTVENNLSPWVVVSLIAALVVIAGGVFYFFSRNNKQEN